MVLTNICCVIVFIRLSFVSLTTTHRRDFARRFFCERVGTMAEGQVRNEARDARLADQLVSNLGLEGAIQFCRVRAWDGVLEFVIALKETGRGNARRA